LEFVFFPGQFLQQSRDLATHADSGHFLVPADLVFISDPYFGDLECLKEQASTLYVAQLLLEGEMFVTSSRIIPMIEEIRKNFKSTLTNFNTVGAPRGVKVLETVIIEFNMRFRDGTNVTQFREGPGRQPQGLHQGKFTFCYDIIFMTDPLTLIQLVVIFFDFLFLSSLYWSRSPPVALMHATFLVFLVFLLTNMTRLGRLWKSCV